MIATIGTIAMIGWVVGAVLPAAALAQIAAPDSSDSSVVRDAARPGVADTVTVLPPVPVEGERGTTPERSTATSVRLDRSRLVRFLPVSTADAMLAVPGVDLVKTGPWASRVALRGLSGDRVLLMVDGVRFNSVRGHGVQPSMVSLDRLEAIEVLPGANSALFGSDALGGVVNLVTHRSLFETTPTAGVTLSARAADPGSAWAQTARARLLTGALGLELSGSLGGRAALVTPEGRIANSGDREDDLSGRLAARWRDALIDYEHVRHAAHDIGLPAFNSAAGATGEYSLQSREADRLELGWPGRRGWPETRLLGVLQTLRTDFTETSVDSVFFRGNFAGTRTQVAADRVRTRSRSLQPTLRLGGFGSLRLVGELRAEEADGPRTTERTSRNRAGDVIDRRTESSESVPPARRDVWGIGAFAKQKLAGVGLEAGLRWDVIRSRADSTVTSSSSRLDVTDRRLSVEGGLSRPFGVFEPYLHVGSGFRAPNLEERYFNNDIHGGMRLFGNPDLESERSVSYEAGLRTGELGRWLASARISAHRAEVQDLITFRYVTLVYGVPRFQYVNVRRARIEGMEYAAELRAAGTRLALNAAFPRGFDRETGARLTDIGTARATIDLIVPLERWLAGGGLATRLRWNDAVWTSDPLLYRKAFTTLSIEGSFVLSGVRSTLAVHNLFDASYREPASFIPEPGRTFALSLRRDFSIPIGLPKGSS